MDQPTQELHICSLCVSELREDRLRIWRGARLVDRSGARPALLITRVRRDARFNRSSHACGDADGVARPAEERYAPGGRRPVLVATAPGATQRRGTSFRSSQRAVGAAGTLEQQARADQTDATVRPLRDG